MWLRHTTHLGVSHRTKRPPSHILASGAGHLCDFLHSIFYAPYRTGHPYSCYNLPVIYSLRLGCSRRFRDHFGTVSVRSKLPLYMPVSPSPVSRETSRDCGARSALRRWSYSNCELWSSGDIRATSQGFLCGCGSCGGYLGYCLLLATWHTALSFTAGLPAGSP